MRATMLDVSARYGYACKEFLPRMHSMTCFHEHLLTEQVEQSDLVVFGGGADIGTSIYGHKAMYPYPGANLGLSERDRFEIAVFEEARRQEKPILGICRGSQLVCALSGGALVQDIDNHCATHPIQTWDEQVGLSITSTHHQQMYLMNLIPNEDYELLAWTDCLSSKYTRDEALAPLAPDCDPEVVFFRNTQAFAIQGHPEYLQQKDPVVKWLQEQLFNYFPELK